MDRNKVSLASFRNEKLTLNTNTLFSFQKQHLTFIAPSPSPFTPLLPKAGLLLMKSLPQDCLESDRLRKRIERRKRWRRREARDEETFKGGASAFQACCKEMPW